jgi:hypothetical protein
MFSCWWWALPDLQLQHLSGARRQRFHVDGGRSRTFSSGTSRGAAVDVFTLMVCAPGPLALTPPGARHRHFHIGGGHSQTFSFGTSRGPAVNVFSLMVCALGPSAPAPLGARRRRFTLVVGAPAPPGGSAPKTYGQLVL